MCERVSFSCKHELNHFISNSVENLYGTRFGGTYLFNLFRLPAGVHYEHLHVMFTCEQCIHISDSTNTPALIYFFTSLFVHYIDPGCLCSAVVMESVSSDQK